MKKEEKGVAVALLQEKFARAKVAVLADFSGMSVEELQEVKGKIRQANGEFTVIKNTLAIRASVGTALEQLAIHFKGPTAVALGFGDPVSPAKAIKIISDKQKKLKIKAGVLENRLIDLAGLKLLAQLPSKQVLIGQLVGRLKSPLASLSGGLGGVLSKFVRVLQAAHETRMSSLKKVA